MMRAFLLLLIPGVLLAGLAVWMFLPVETLPATYAHADCRRAFLVDRTTGNPLVGIEDMELNRTDRSLYFSSYDRLAGRGARGGVYQVPLLSLGSGGEVRATPVTDPEDFRHGLRPHGMALSRNGERLAFVNRRRDGTVAIIEGPITDSGLRVRMRYRRKGRLCRANDLVFADGNSTLLTTLDRASCDPDLADLVPWTGTGSVVAIDTGGREEPVTVATDLAFANGIAPPYVAETRGSRLVRPEDRRDAFELPGGPDNVTLGVNGEMVVAVHPSLVRLWIYRSGVPYAAPSRIVRVFPLADTIEVLFEDRQGELFAGATSAVVDGTTLIAGSVREEGLLICERRG